jgi:hypothetical protein
MATEADVLLRTLHTGHNGSRTLRLRYLSSHVTHIDLCYLCRLRVRCWKPDSRRCIPALCVPWSGFDTRLRSDILTGNVYNGSCQIVDGLTTNQNPCTQPSGIFDCTPPPLMFGAYTSSDTGIKYTCFQDNLTETCGTDPISVCVSLQAISLFTGALLTGAHSLSVASNKPANYDEYSTLLSLFSLPCMRLRLMLKAHLLRMVSWQPH